MCAFPLETFTSDLNPSNNKRDKPKFTLNLLVKNLSEEKDFIDLDMCFEQTHCYKI